MKALRPSINRRAGRQTERAIRQGKMEWEAAFDSVSDIIVLTDPKGMIIRCNKKLIDYFHTTYSGVLGRRITDLFFGEINREESVFSCSSEIRIDREAIRLPLLPGWYNVASYPINPTEGALGYVHIIKDVTRQKKMEEEQALTERELLALYAVASRLNSRRGSKRIMIDLLSQLHRMLKINYSGIYLLKRGTLTLTAGLGLSRKFKKKYQTCKRDEVWVKGVLDGKIVTSADSPGVPIQELECRGRWCAVPLRIGSGVIGIMFVAHRLAGDYTYREVNLLSSIANQLAILIENHLLYDRMKVKNDELNRKKQELKEHLEKAEQANVELGRLNAAKNILIMTIRLF